MKRYKFDQDGVCEIPELGLHFKFYSIDPERKTKCGAWPYCISYQTKGLDAFGLGDYGSNYRVENPENAESILNELVSKFAEESLRAIRISKLGSREYQVGHKYKVRFESQGLIHSGTYFESFRDIKEYFERVNEGKPHRCEAAVFLAVTKDYIGRYIQHSNGEIEYIKNEPSEVTNGR